MDETNTRDCREVRVRYRVSGKAGGNYSGIGVYDMADQLLKVTRWPEIRSTSLV